MKTNNFSLEDNGMFTGMNSEHEIAVFKTLAKYRLGLTLMDVANKTHLPMFVVRRNLEELIKKGDISFQNGAYRLPSASKKVRVEEIKADLLSGMGEKLIERMLNDDACGIEITFKDGKTVTLETTSAVDYIFRLACFNACIEIGTNEAIAEALNSAAERIALAQIEAEQGECK